MQMSVGHSLCHQLEGLAEGVQGERYGPGAEEYGRSGAEEERSVE